MERWADSLDVRFRFSFGLSPTIDKERHPTGLMVSPEIMIRLEASDPVYRQMGENYATVENNWGKAFDAGEFVPLFICNPGVNDLFIDFHGNAMPCASFRCAGVNMLMTPFKQIWMDFDRFKHMPASAKNSCMYCESRYYCRVCPADQYQYYGDYESTQPSLCAHAFARKRLFKDGWPIEQVVNILAQEVDKG